MQYAQFDINKLKVASPCPVGWESMKGDDRTRHCDVCKLNVYNISELSRNEVANLVASNRDRLCVRLYRRADGTVLTKDCPVGFRAYQKKLALYAGAALSAILGLFSISFAQKDGKSSVDSVKPHIITLKDVTGQYNLEGNVRDPNGAVIPNAQIFLYKEGEKNSVKSTTSDADGHFAFGTLPEGIYRIEVREGSGFKKLVVENIRVMKGKMTEIMLEMYPASDSVWIGIVADDPMIDMSVAGPTPTRIRPD